MGAFLLRVGDPPARYGKRPNPANDGLREQMRHADAAERRRLIDQQRPWLPTMFDSYQAGDGGWVFVLAGNSRRNSVQLVKALEIYDALIAAGMVDVPPYPDLTRPNNIQDVDGLSREWKKILRDRMTAAFRHRPAADWTPIMRAARGAVQRAPQHAGVAARAGDRCRRAHRRGGRIRCTERSASSACRPRSAVPRSSGTCRNRPGRATSPRCWPPSRPWPRPTAAAPTKRRARLPRPTATAAALPTRPPARRPFWPASRCSTCPPCWPVPVAPRPWRSMAPT